MHPWEDFAETFATYLGMVRVLDTARNMGFDGGPATPDTDFEPMVDHYQWLGMTMNEMNRAIGLIDLVPQGLVPPVREKLRYVYSVVHEARPAYR